MRDRVAGALALALAGLAAATVHVALETPGELRDWRQTLPLAAIVGFCLGFLMMGPALRAGPRRAAVDGAAATVGGFVAFALFFGLGHGVIAGAGGAADPLGEIVGAAQRALLSAFGATGAAALAGAAGLSAAASAGLRRLGPPADEETGPT